MIAPVRKTVLHAYHGVQEVNGIINMFWTLVPMAFLLLHPLGMTPQSFEYITYLQAKLNRRM